MDIYRLTKIISTLLCITLRGTSSFHIPTKRAFTHRGEMSMTKVLDNEALSENMIQTPQEAEGVIFDIDGTLANSWKLGYDASQVVLANNQIQAITEELYHECTKYSTPERLARHAGLLPEKDGIEFVEIGNALAKEFDDLYVGLVSIDTAAFYDGISELIVGLPHNCDASNGRIVKVAALTNACVAYAHAVLKTNCPLLNGNSEYEGETGIYERFISIHGADTVSKPKPSPEGLLKCCQEIDISPQRCVYIGDSPSDAVAAKASGMLAIGVSWGSHTIESLDSAPFDYLCHSVEELKDLLPSI